MSGKRLIGFSVLLSGFGMAGAAHAAGSPCMEEFDAAVVRYADEDYRGAEEQFESLLKRCPGKADLHVWLGRAAGRHAERASWFRAMGLAKKTRRAFEMAVELEPAHAEGLAALIDYYVSAPGIVGGGVDKAVPLAERLEKAAPADGDRAWAQIHRARDEWKEAEERIRRAMVKEPDEVGHVLALGSLCARQGRRIDSDRAYASAFEMAPDDPAVWYSRADSLIRMEREPEEARRLLERYLAAELEPTAEPRSAARKLLDKL